MELGFFHAPSSATSGPRCQKIIITDDNKQQHIYSFERLSLEGVTYLNVGNIPSTEYHLSYDHPSSNLDRYWPSKTTGVNIRGSFFDCSTGKILYSAYKKLLADTSKAQSKLDSILKKIEEYEALGTKTVQAIQDKIGLAQQDMAGFIAELSAFMPQQSVQSGSTNRWTFTPGEVCHSMDNLEGCSSWRDTFELLCDNLQLAGIGSQWTTMLSSFLYSSYLNRMPLLLAGPNANAIADALSMTICGQKIDLLKCCGEQDAEAISGFVESDMAAVQNPFHPGWVSCISHSNNGFALWLHPFTEDLQIEPRSLYYIK